MTATTATGPLVRAGAKRSSLRRNRKWALYASYFFLILFAIFFLMPPYYMIVTALKSDAEVAHMAVGSSRVDLQACKLEYSIVSPK